MRFCEVPNCKYPVFSTDKITRKGYCRSHATKFRTDLDRRSIIQKAIAKQKTISTKVRSLQDIPANKEMLIEKGIIKDNELELWYFARRYQMVGYCTECSKPTQPKHDKYFKWSIAHICPKSIVPSVATNYFNWLELCQICHQEFDNTFERAKNMKCFPEAKRKFNLFKDLIPSEELRKVNPFLLI